MMDGKRSVLIGLRKAICVFSLVGTATFNAAAEPVARGFPAWEGLEDDNLVSGRTLCPSDLRHKITVVVEIEPKDEESALAQMTAAGKLAALDSTYMLYNRKSVSLEYTEIPRGVSVVVVNYGEKKGEELIKDLLEASPRKVGRTVTRMNTVKIPIYGKGVAFPGSPTAPEGRRPFAYVMGPEGTEPIFTRSLDAKGVSAVVRFVRRAAKTLPKWRRFYGTLEEVRFFGKLEQSLNPVKPKPLAPVVQNIRKGISSEDPDEAREAQMLFDAIEQERSELVYRISMEVDVCPHRALYDLSRFLKYFPGERKSVEAYAEKIKDNSDAKKLCAVLSEVLEWSDPEFECRNNGEAKKIVVRLNTMKRTVELLAKTKDLPIQNGAHVIGAEIDRLIEVIPTKVKSK